MPLPRICLVLAACLLLGPSSGLSAQAGAPAPTAPVSAPQAATNTAPQATAPTAAPSNVPATSATQVGAPAAQTLGSANTPNAGNTIRTNVRLVVLDLVVVDGKGNTVRDLSREGFHVQEDGEDQAIRYFEVPGRNTPSPDLTIDSTADLDRLAPRAPVNIVLLDEFNTRFEDMAFARYSLKKWLEKQPDKLDTPTMLVSVSLEKFDVLHDYTQNKEALLFALDHHFAAYPWQAHQFAWVAERYATAFFTLRRVAEASVGHEGHKNMIWIGRGFPNINLARFAVDAQNRVNNAVQQTVNELRDARVTLYTIDPAGILVDPGVYGEGALWDPFGGEPNFKKLAQATGGRNLYGRNDVDAEIGTSIRDGASFYALSYRPTDTVRDVNKFRKISVSVVGRPDLKVITRQGYFDSRAPARLRADNEVNSRLTSELAAAATSRMVYDGVPMALIPGEVPGKYRLHLDGTGLVWSPVTDTDPQRKAKLILTVTTFDKKGKVLKADGRVITVAAGKDVAPSGRLLHPVMLEYQVPPNAKAVRARFVVRVDATGRMATADADLTQPAQKAGNAPMPQPVLPSGGAQPPPASTPQP